MSLALTSNSFHTSALRFGGGMGVRRTDGKGSISSMGCAGRLGTSFFLNPLNPIVRAVRGWFTVERSEFFRTGHARTSGTASRVSCDSAASTAAGWFAVRQPGHFAMESEGEEPPTDYHISVLPDEIIEWMAPSEDKWIIDGTLGGGGHSESFLKRGARVLGIDRDPEALAYARARLACYGDRFLAVEGSFSHITEIPEVRKEGQADGLLLDLGVSSRQLDAAERGFSFQKDGPLDMRMGPSLKTSAADLVNTWAETDIVRLLREFGEEPSARKIARAIVERRARKPFETTLDLAGCIESVVPRRGRTHPATRSFQAIRMAVNEELDQLEKALDASLRLLKPGGRLLVITFHSLEDRIVKQFLRRHSEPWIDQPGWPEPRPNPDCHFRLLFRKALPPSEKEISRNPRARSSKLRAAERLDTP